MTIDNTAMSDSCFDKYLSLVHKLSGITIQKNRKTMLVGRIRKRLAKLKLSNYEEYLEYIKKNCQEEEFFINAMTTNETYCYRTPRIWDFITNSFLEDWHKNNNKKKLNIWSAASSTGEEAHTMGIFCQNFKNNNLGFQYKILGTDISSEVVAKATEGSYIGRSVERFRQAKPALFQKYMKGTDENGYKVLPEIKSNIQFETHNLFEKLRNNEKFDLILLRNVLIYFTKEDQEKVLANIHKCLSRDGYLIIGESESLNRISTDFEPVSPLIYSSKLRNKDAA